MNHLSPPRPHLREARARTGLRTPGSGILPLLALGILSACGGRVQVEELQAVAGSAPDTAADAPVVSDTGVGGSAGAGGSGGYAGMAGSGGSGGTAGAAGACASCGPLEQCWQDHRCVAKLVTLPQGYAIDATEVTRGQYAAWMATDPSTDGQDAWCGWNTSFLPTYSAPKKGCVAEAWPPASDMLQYPMGCVDWCDAQAYCRGVGKRLCGAIGGGANPLDAWADPAASQWFNACSSGGLHNYPYGGNPDLGETDGYEPETCGTADPSAYALLPVGSFPECVSHEPGYEGVYDLSGNVWEWEDSCTGPTDQYDSCRARGGAAGDNAERLRCAEDTYAIQFRLFLHVGLGFRCCAP